MSKVSKSDGKKCACKLCVECGYHHPARDIKVVDNKSLCGFHRERSVPTTTWVQYNDAEGA